MRRTRGLFTLAPFTLAPFTLAPFRRWFTLAPFTLAPLGLSALLVAQGCYRSHRVGLMADGGADVADGGVDAAEAAIIDRASDRAIDVQTDVIDICQLVDCTPQCDVNSPNMFVAGVGDGNPLLRVNVETRQVTLVGQTQNVYVDIAYHVSRRLVGSTFDGLWWIDPQTAQETPIGTPTWNGDLMYPGNSMIAAADGSIYFNAGIQDGQGQVIARLDLRLGLEVSEVIPTTLSGGGDLAFSDGRLYWATADGDLVEVELDTQRIRRIGQLPQGTYGIANRSDGTGFAAAGSQIFDLDFQTARTSDPFSLGLLNIYGVAMEQEGCASR